jgi:hypothetical protein
MGLLERAKADIEKYSSDTTSGFAVELTFKRPDPETQTAVIKGLYTETTLDVDEFGNITNSKKVHIAFSEKFMIDAGYAIRNSRNQIDMNLHQVSVIDIVTGDVKKYIIGAWFPDTTIGFITCILHDLKS